MKPFDLTLALQGEPVVTRDGLSVYGISKFKNRSGIYGVIESESGEFVVSWSGCGHYNINESKSNYDIFMAPRKQTLWVNVYKKLDGTIYTNAHFLSKDGVWMSSGGDLNSVCVGTYPLDTEY